VSLLGFGLVGIVERQAELLELRLVDFEDVFGLLLVLVEVRARNVRFAIVDEIAEVVVVPGSVGVHGRSPVQGTTILPGGESVANRSPAAGNTEVMPLAASRDDPECFGPLFEDERAALDYLVRVFQLEEIREARTEMGDDLLSWLRVGDGVVMIGRANAEVHQIHSPQTIGGTTVQMMVYVHDVDAHYAHAVDAGADITMTVQDAFYGERRYEATDLEGHRWHFAERFGDIKARGGTVPDAPEGGSA
jgi:PhnB protein